jgi:hypothetical protein
LRGWLRRFDEHLVRRHCRLFWYPGKFPFHNTTNVRFFLLFSTGLCLMA